MNEYDSDTLIRFTLTVTTAITNLPIDPDNITASIRDENDIITDLHTIIEHDAVGFYHLDYAPPGYGLYKLHWSCTGNVEATKTCSFYVKQPYE